MTSTSPDRVREHTRADVNERIDRETQERVHYYSVLGGDAIERRFDELDREWDIERVLETNASALAFTGLALGFLTRKRGWFAIPGLVLPFLFQHAVQGWCPPVPVLRRLGVRTRREIDREKFALKAARGDLNVIANAGEPVERAQLTWQAVQE